MMWCGVRCRVLYEEVERDVLVSGVSRCFGLESFCDCSCFGKRRVTCDAKRASGKGEVCGRGSPGESLVGDRCMRGGLGDCDGGDPVCADGEG